MTSGKDGSPFPAYLLPSSWKNVDALYSWSCKYQEYDRIWFGGDKFEIPVYRELADPNLELAREGRELCRNIEAATNLPTYYYLMRYWGRKKGESKRRCPGCGKAWNRNPKGPGIGWFDFLCRPCRLVSHLAKDWDEEKYAHIGEYKKGRKAGRS